MPTHAKETIGTNWTCSTSIGQHPTFDQIALLHRQRQVDALERVANRLDQLVRVVTTLDAILSRLDTLGREGLHDVVRELAHEARAKRKRRLVRRRRARAAKKAQQLRAA